MLAISTTTLKNDTELLYTSKDNWGGFLHVHHKPEAGVGELKAADLDLLKYAHSELLKEKSERYQADAQVRPKYRFRIVYSSEIPSDLIQGLAALKAQEAKQSRAQKTLPHVAAPQQVPTCRGFVPLYQTAFPKIFRICFGSCPTNRPRCAARPRRRRAGTTPTPGAASSPPSAPSGGAPTPSCALFAAPTPTD